MLTETKNIYWRVAGEKVVEVSRSQVWQGIKDRPLDSLNIGGSKALSNKWHHLTYWFGTDHLSCHANNGLKAEAEIGG